MMNETIRRALGLSIQTPTEFFCKCWEELIEKIENGDPDVDISNWPRQILQSIEIEIYHNANEVKKKKDIQNLVMSYNRLSKPDSLVGNLLNYTVFDPTKNGDLIIDIKKEHQNLNDKLFDAACNSIINEVNNCRNISFEFKKKIECLVGIIIDEFIYKGFDISSLKDLSKHPISIRSTEFGDVIIAPSLFEEINRENYDSEKNYFNELSDYLRKRDISKRIGTISEHFHNMVSTFTVCYRVTGLRGNINISIGEVRLFSNLSCYDDSRFHRGKWDKNYIYAAVDIEAGSPESALIKGMSAVESVINLLTLKVQAKKPFVVSAENAVVFQKDEVCVDKSIIRKDDTANIIYYESTDIQHYIPDLKDSYRWLENPEKDSPIKKEIINSLFWYRKACNSVEDSDKLLFSWIAMDNIFKDVSKREKIPTMCSNIISPHLYYTQWYILYTYIKDCIDSEYLNIPEELKEKSGLNISGGQVIPKEKFLYNLEDIENFTDDEILKTKIQETKRLYVDLKVFEKRKDSIIKDIQMIQIIRNMMVHSAVFSKNTIRIYANKSYNYCTCILNCIMYNLEKQDNKPSLKDMIAWIDEENEKKIKQIKCEIEKRAE